MNKLRYSLRLLPLLVKAGINRFASNAWQDKIDSILKDKIEAIREEKDLELCSGELDLSESIYRALAEKTRANGAILIPSVFSGEILDKLQAEFRALIDTADDSGYTVTRGGEAACVRVKPRLSLNPVKFPATAAFYNSDVIRNIAQEFYRDDPKGFTFNSEIFVHETPETTTPLAGPLHWDRAQTLKFWLYIDDLPLEAGPMQIHPGSTIPNQEERREKWRHANRKLVGGSDNMVNAPADEIKPCIGSRGSVLIHDTDCSHGATTVQHGFVRRIMRGHCRGKTELQIEKPGKT